MNQKQQIKAITTQGVRLTTSSILRLQIPEEHKQKKCLFEWASSMSRNHQQLSANPLTNIIAKQEYKKLGRDQDYRCCPLDYGLEIYGKIMIENGLILEIVKQVHFGVVSIQNQIACQIQNPERSQIKMAINKNNLVKGQIKIEEDDFHFNNKQRRINILLDVEQLKFCLKVSKETTIPANNAFLKFYQKQENCIGLSMFHQHSQFMEKLKQIKVFLHFGFFIKVYFENRFFRDIFIFQLMRLCGVIIPELQKKQAYHINIKPVQSQLVPNSQDFKKKSIIENKPKDKEVDDQIYKLLYQASQIGSSSQVSFDAADAEFLFASIKKSDIRKSILNNIMKESICFSNPKQTKNQQLNNIKNSQQNNKSFKFRSTQLNVDSQTNKNSKQITQRGSLEKSKGKQFKNNYLKPQNYDWLRNNSASSFGAKNNQNQLRSTISKLTTQIDGLIKENKKLSSENKKLKDENMRLRFKQIKNQSKVLNKGKQKKKSKNESQRIAPIQPTQQQQFSPKSLTYGIAPTKPLQIEIRSRRSPNVSKSFAQKQKTSPNFSPTLTFTNKGNPDFPQRNKTITFTTMSTMTNNQFMKQSQIQRRQQVRNEPLNKNFTNNYFPKRMKQIQKSKQSVHFQQVHSPSKGNRNLYESTVPDYGQQMGPETPFFHSSTQHTLNFATSSSHFFSKYINN